MEWHVVTSLDTRRRNTCSRCSLLRTQTNLLSPLTLHWSDHANWIWHKWMTDLQRRSFGVTQIAWDWRIQLSMRPSYCQQPNPHSYLWIVQPITRLETRWKTLVYIVNLFGPHNAMVYKHALKCDFMSIVIPDTTHSKSETDLSLPFLFAPSLKFRPIMGLAWQIGHANGTWTIVWPV